MPNFEVGDYVLYARVRRPGVTPKLMATWTGPWRVVGAHHPHLFEIQNIVSGRVHTAHVDRLRFYADSQLNVTADVKNVFQHAFNQGQFQMAGVVRVAEADDRSLIVLSTGLVLKSTRGLGSLLRRFLRPSRNFSQRSCGSCVCLVLLLLASSANLSLIHI